jgi:uncharacterized membrane protein SpoIIM required for sporulation
MPVMGAAMVLFFMAALIEGFFSPSSAPIELKSLFAVFCSSLLAVYFIVLGFPRGIMMPVENDQNSEEPKNQTKT